MHFSSFEITCATLLCYCDVSEKRPFFLTNFYQGVAPLESDIISSTLDGAFAPNAL